MASRWSSMLVAVKLGWKDFRRVPCYYSFPFFPKSLESRSYAGFHAAAVSPRLSLATA